MRPKSTPAVTLALVALVSQSGCGSTPGPTAARSGPQPAVSNIQSGPRLEFKIDDHASFVEECGTEKIKSVISQAIEKSSLLKGSGPSVVYATYEPKETEQMADAGTIISSRFEHKVSILVKNSGGQTLSQYDYGGTVSGAVHAYMANMPLPGNPDRQVRVPQSELHCDLIATDLTRRLRATPLP